MEIVERFYYASCIKSSGAVIEMAFVPAIKLKYIFSNYKIEIENIFNTSHYLVVCGHNLPEDGPEFAS